MGARFVIPGASGLGGGGGGLHFRDPPDEYAAASLTAARTLRDTYFAATANAAALMAFQGDQSLAIIVSVTGATTRTFETYLPGQTGMDYAADQWVERTDAVQGDTGGTGSQGRGSVSIYRNSATALSTAPVGGLIPSAGGTVTPPTDWTLVPTAVVAGEDTYESVTVENPAVDTYPLVPTWSVPFDVGNAAGAEAAQAAAEAAQAAAETAQAAAEAAESDAETAESAASTSATAAASSASSASTDAGNASGSASSASTDASAASTSATAASGSATTAGTAETSARTAEIAAEAAQAAAEAAQAAAEAAAAGAETDGTVLFGSGVPADSLGKDNDAYLDQDVGIIYEKVGGAWVLRYEFASAGGGGGGGGGDHETLLNEVVTDGPVIAGIARLAAAVSDSATTFSLDAASSETLELGDFLLVEDEIVRITTLTSQTSVIVSRAEWDTTAVLHAITTPVGFLPYNVGRVIDERTWVWDADTNQNVFDLGRALDPEADGTKTLDVDASWYDRQSKIRHIDHFEIGVAQLLRTRDHPLTGDSLHDTAGHVISRTGQGTLSGGNLMEFIYTHRRLTAADETAGRGTEGHDALVVALRGPGSIQPIYLYQAHIYLVGSTPTLSHARYAAVRTTADGNTFTAADFTAATATTATGDEIALPDWTDGENRYMAFAVPSTVILTDIRPLNGPFNLIVAFTAQTTTIILGGEDHTIWLYDAQLLPSAAGQSWVIQ